MTTQKTENTYRSLVKELIEQIVSGVFKDYVLPGENELCKKFNVSRTTLRSALQVLDAKNIVKKQAKKKTVINNREEWDWFDPKLIEYTSEFLDKKELLYHVGALRMTFEPQASALCALNADFSDLAELDNGNKMMQDAIITKNSKLFTQGDVSFHRAIFKGTHNPFFIRLSELIIHTSILSILTTLDTDLEDSKQAIEDHIALMTAIRFKQAKKAQKIMDKILKESLSKIFKDDLPNYYQIL